LNQGPGFFGMEPVFANNVVIKNGNIGLSSHHGIHGHYNKDVVIEDVHIYDFETHGVQMSYFENLKMKNVEIGPSSTVAYLKGEYAYARWTILQLSRIYESGEYNDIFPVTFSGRDVALEFEDIIDNLRDLMDIAFKAVMGVEGYAEHDPQYQVAKDLFINEDGLPYGAVMYGMFLNLWFANVFTIHPSKKYASGAVLENINIHGLHHKTMEYRRLDDMGSAMFRNQFNAPLDAEALLGDQIELGYEDIVWADVSYKGSVLSDAEILLAMVTDDWEELGLTYMQNNFTDWALGTFQWDDNDTSPLTPNTPYIGCNVDRMGHVPKGIIGIRMDGVEDVVFRDLKISDLHEQSQRGSDLCGEYWDEGFTRFIGKGNTLQNAPYLYGYTGNYAHGIFSDWSTYTFSGEVEVSSLVSDTGLVRGVGMYRQTELTLEEGLKLTVKDLSAGHKLYNEDTSDYSKPYNPTVAKPFHIMWANSENFTVDTVDNVLKTFNASIIGEAKTVEFSCIFGRDGMNDTDWEYSSDNSDCDLLDDVTGTFAGNERDLAVISEFHRAYVRWNLKTLMLAMTVVFVLMIGVWAMNRWSAEKSKLSSATETAPLLL